MSNFLKYCIFNIHWSLYCYASMILLSSLIRGTYSDCTLLSDDESWHKKEMEFLKRLEPLKGTVFNITGVSVDGKSKYNYSVGICTVVDDSKPMSGAVQRSANESHNLGLINSTEVLGGDVWISLQYNNGENYSSHCSHQPRLANIMIICDESATTEKLTYVEERRRQVESGQCYYLFELNTKVICPEKKDKLSTGSVICLIIIPCCGIYLLLGFLYRRVVVGAKGLEQIPNYGFWQEFGNLQADGCDFICRCGSRQQSQAYRGIDDCLDREEEERDDQLLTM